MIDRVVALGGPPGSGKTTAARRLAAELGLDLVSAGEQFRAQASARGMDLGAYSAFAEAHAEVDRELDEAMARAAQPGRILEGRVQGPLLRRRGVPVYWLAVVARLEVRAERSAKRDAVPVDVARARMVEREASERTRYLALYALDVDAESPDLTVDSSEKDAAQVVAELARFLEAHGAQRVR